MTPNRMRRRRILAATSAAPVLCGLNRFAVAQADARGSVIIAMQKIVNSNTLEVLREQSNVGERVFHTSPWDTLIGRKRRGDLVRVPGLATTSRRIDDRTVELELR